MNKYSFLQQKLHQLALSSKLVREVMFDAENSIVSTKQSTDSTFL